MRVPRTHLIEQLTSPGDILLGKPFAWSWGCVRCVSCFPGQRRSRLPGLSHLCSAASSFSRKPPLLCPPAARRLGPACGRSPYPPAVTQARRGPPGACLSLTRVRRGRGGVWACACLSGTRTGGPAPWACPPVEQPGREDEQQQVSCLSPCPDPPTALSHSSQAGVAAAVGQDLAPGAVFQGHGPEGPSSLGS